MDVNVVKEYLVSIGFSIDKGQYDKFNGTINSITEVVTKHTEGMTKQFAKAGAAIISAYASVGTAALTLMDKMATADLGYQLYAVRMLTSVDAAKKLKIATDALGHSLDEIAWNQELREHFKELVEIQKTMQTGLGTNYESNMKGIRDIMFEVTKFKVEMGYLGQGIASSIFKAFGGEGTFLDKLKEWNTWIIEHLPQIRNKINEYLIPILKDFWAILKNIGIVGKELFNVFADFIGVLSGDDKIMKAKTSMDKFGQTMLALSGFIKRCSDYLTTFVSILIQVAGYLVGSRMGAAIGGFIGGVIGGPAGAVVGAGIGSQIFGLLGLGVGTIEATKFENRIKASEKERMLEESNVGYSKRSAEGVKSRMTSDEWGRREKEKSFASIGETFEEKAAFWEKHFGLPPGLVRAVGMRESSGKLNIGLHDPSKSSAYGPGGITYATGQFLGIDRKNPDENVMGMAKYLRYLLDLKGGDLQRAIAGYKEGPGGEITASTNRYVRDVSRYMGGATQVAKQGDTYIIVYARTNDGDEIGRGIKRQLSSINKNKVGQNTIEPKGSFSDNLKGPILAPGT
jgi:hypothetical protein